MATPKPKRNYEYIPPIAYQPSPEELKELVGFIEKQVKVPLGADFTETVRRLWILYRGQVDRERTAPKHDAQYEELEQLRKPAAKLHRILSHEGMSAPLHNRFIGLTITNDLGGESDPLYGIRRHLESFLLICNKARKEYLDEVGKGRLTLAKFRHIVAEELARALDKAGYKPTTTRGGPFEECLEALLGRGSCTIQGRQIIDKPLNDYHFLVRLAVKNYPTKPTYSLLEVKKLPGITG